MYIKRGRASCILLQTLLQIQMTPKYNKKFTREKTETEKEKVMKTFFHVFVLLCTILSLAHWSPTPFISWSTASMSPPIPWLHHQIIWSFGVWLYHTMFGMGAVLLFFILLLLLLLLLFWFLCWFCCLLLLFCFDFFCNHIAGVFLIVTSTFMVSYLIFILFIQINTIVKAVWFSSVRWCLCFIFSCLINWK